MNNQLTYSNSLPDDVDLSVLTVSEEPVEPVEDSPTVTSVGAVFNAVFIPDFTYLAATSKISLSDIPNFSTVSVHFPLRPQ